MTFVQPETFAGSQFPASKQDHLFVTESGPTYASGPQSNGKKLVEFVLDAEGDLVSGPTTIVEYRGTGQGSMVGLAAGPDGLYFTEMYEDSGANGPTGPGARIFRVRYVNSIVGDYNIDGVANQGDYDTWRENYGSNLLLGADGNHNGVVDTADYVIWRKAFGNAAAAGAQALAPSVSAPIGRHADDRASDSPSPNTPQAGSNFSLSETPAVTNRASFRPMTRLPRQADSTASRDDALLAALEHEWPAAAHYDTASDPVAIASDDLDGDEAFKSIDEAFMELALI
jgi:hypothetical protein